MIEVNGITIYPKHLQISTYSSKHKSAWVPRVDNGVLILHKPTGVVSKCDSERSQHRNRALALEDLKQKLKSLGWNGGLERALWNDIPCQPWKERSYYRIKVSLGEGNPERWSIFYTGFLSDDRPSGYACIFNPTYDSEPLTYDDCPKAKVSRVRFLFTEGDE